MTRTFTFGFKKILFTAAALFALCLSSIAQESLITSVTISKPKELNGSYQLTVKADKPVDYKTKADSSDSIYFDLKNSLALDNIDTIYDNVSGIDGLIVQQLENSKVRIYVKGINTSSTKLVFATLQPTGSKASNQVVINRPIREYRPTSDINELIEEDMNWDENSFNPEHLTSSFFGIFDSKPDVTLIICLALLVLCVVVSKKVFAKIRVQEEPLIGLSSAYQKEDAQDNKEEILNNMFNTAKNMQGPMSLSQRAKMQSAAEVKTASKYVSNSYQRPRPQPAAARNQIKQNYALGAYQKAQKNPYATAAQNTFAKPVSYQKRVQRPAESYVSRPQKREEIPVAPSNKGASIENIKFLESVTKIYEQSGRRDLAQGLRAGITKKKTAV